MVRTEVSQYVGQSGYCYIVLYDIVIYDIVIIIGQPKRETRPLDHLSNINDAAS